MYQEVYQVCRNHKTCPRIYFSMNISSLSICDCFTLAQKIGQDVNVESQLVESCWINVLLGWVWNEPLCYIKCHMYWHFRHHRNSKGFSSSTQLQESTCNARDHGSIPGLGRSPRGGHGNPHQYSCLENPHGQKNLMDYSPWNCKESDMTQWISTTHI